MIMTIIKRKKLIVVLFIISILFITSLIFNIVSLDNKSNDDTKNDTNKEYIWMPMPVREGLLRVKLFINNTTNESRYHLFIGKIVNGNDSLVSTPGSIWIISNNSMIISTYADDLGYINFTVNSLIYSGIYVFRGFDNNEVLSNSQPMIIVAKKYL